MLLRCYVQCADVLRPLVCCCCRPTALAPLLLLPPLLRLVLPLLLSACRRCGPALSESSFRGGAAGRIALVPHSGPHTVVPAVYTTFPCSSTRGTERADLWRRRPQPAGLAAAGRRVPGDAAHKQLCCG